MEAARAVQISPSLIYQEIHKSQKALCGGFYWSDINRLESTVQYASIGQAKEVLQYDLRGKYITSYPSTGIAAKAINGVHSHIGECCRGKIKSYKGFIWRYTEDIVSPIDESQ